MTEIINNISEISQKYDAIVFDQWGVLHDGKLAYEGVIACLEGLKKNNTRLAVLSNSGKRSEPNEKRILEMGFSNLLFEFIMTSGEALWRDIAYKIIKEKMLKGCKPLKSMPIKYNEKYDFLNNISSYEISKIIKEKSLNIEIVNQVVNNNMKVIGLLILFEGEEVYVPCYPSSINVLLPSFVL